MLCLYPSNSSVSKIILSIRDDLENIFIEFFNSFISVGTDFSGSESN